MSIPKSHKLRSLLDAWQPGTVATSAYLKAQSVTAQDAQKYVASQWLTPLGRGAFKRPKETVTWQGALYSVQSQLERPVHVGGLTVLERAGRIHYLRLGGSSGRLFSPPNIILPQWFRTHFGDQVSHVQTKFLPADIGLNKAESFDGFPLKVASVERSCLEILQLAPSQFSLVEASLIFESLTTLRPRLMQSLLAACTSVKVKRLFLYFAERANLPIVRHLAIDQLDLGAGDRSLVRNGRYVSKYKLLLPAELVDGDTAYQSQ
jgi:hypothetical protein